MGTLQKMKWTVVDEAIHRGYNFASTNEKMLRDSMQDVGTSLHAVLKHAYQTGFLHGFEHKFDNTNYEEKEDGNTL